MIKARNRIDKNIELENCNIIKILMMISVIIYHSTIFWSSTTWFNQAPVFQSNVIAYISEWLGGIHVYTFTFISGYLFYYLKYECGKYDNFKVSIKKRARRLLRPYIITSIIWCIPFFVLYFNGNIKEVFKRFFLAMAPSQLWFLIMLFGVFSFFLFISDWFNSISFNRNILFLSLIFILYLIIKMFKLPNIFQIVSINRHIVFFGMGFIFRKYNMKLLYKINYMIWPILNILLLLINNNINNKIFSNIITLGINITGILIVFIGVNKYIRVKKSKIYIFLKNNNFIMYLFHQQFIYITISFFNGNIGSYYLAIINFVVSSIGSAIIAIIISKNKKISIAFGLK